MFALERPARAPRLAQLRLPPGRRQARSAARPRELPVQRDHRGHRAGRRHPARRHQSAPGGGRAQRPHPQALAPGRIRRRPDRRAGPISPTPTSIWAPGRRRSKRWSTASTASPSVLREAKQPMVIVGAAAAARADGAAVLAAAAQDRASRDARARRRAGTRFNVLQRRRLARRRPRPRLRAGRGRARRGGHAGGRRQGCARRGLPAWAPMRSTCSALGKAFVVYQGSHGDAGAQRADVVLPGAAYTEKSATYVNTEGRAQMTGRAAFAPGDAKEDWAIVRALSAPCRPASCPTTTFRRCAPPCTRRRPALARLDAVEPAGIDGRGGARRARRCAGDRAVRRAPCATSTSPTRSRAPPPSWPSSARSPRAMQQGTTGTHG